jgi:hypothetical protein
VVYQLLIVHEASCGFLATLVLTGGRPEGFCKADIHYLSTAKYVTIYYIITFEEPFTKDAAQFVRCTWPWWEAGESSTLLRSFTD